MSDKVKERYNNLNEYLISKYWEDFISGREKEILQSFREDLVEAYRLTKEEQRAIMFIDSIKIDGKPLSYRMR